jgi:hypothetical protein
MPAKTVLFDAKANPVHDLGLSPRNFLCYQPQSRLLLVAGFGNLSGAIDVWDRKTMKKVAEILAPNATVCEWSPDGNYIMTATLSPRLRVDNGLKIWWCGGGLLHQELIPELYQVCFLLFLSRQRLVARSLKLKFFPTYFSFVGSLAAASPLPMPSLPRYYPYRSRPFLSRRFPPSSSPQTCRCRSLPSPRRSRHLHSDHLPPRRPRWSPFYLLPRSLASLRRPQRPAGPTCAAGERSEGGGRAGPGSGPGEEEERWCRVEGEEEEREGGRRTEWAADGRRQRHLGSSGRGCRRSCRSPCS